MAKAQYINPYRMFNGSIIPNWLMIRKEINSSTKLVYARLGQYAGKKGVAWPQKETLAREVGLSKDMVSLCLEKLAEHGLIEVRRRPVDGRPNQSNEYRFLEHAWFNEEDESDDGDPEEGGGGSPLPPRGEPAPPRGGTPIRPRGEPATGSLREPLEESHLGRESNEACGPLATLAADSSHPEKLASPALTSRTTTPGQVSETAAPAEGGSPTASAVEDIVAATVAKVAREKLERLGAIASDAGKKTEEEKARKKAKRFKEKPWQPPPGEVEELSPEAAKGSPKGQLMRVWRSEMQSVFPDSPVSSVWGQREYGQAQLLLDRYELDRVEDAFRYVIRNWQKIQERMFKGRGSPVPGIGVVLALHASLVPEAAVWVKHREVIEEYEKFGSEYQERPHDLVSRYLEAQKDLKALGL